jgi:chemotaxis protein histidine kinase CheA
MAAQQGVQIDPRFDPEFLDVYTGGDVRIRDQVLALFLEQAALLLDRLKAAQGDARAWFEVAHSLKGCAAGVGAAGVADLARVAEKGSDAPAEMQFRMLDDLQAALSATAEQVRAVLAGAAGS